MATTGLTVGTETCLRPPDTADEQRVVVVHDRYRTMLEAAAFWPELRDVITLSIKRWKTLSSVRIGRNSTGGKQEKGGNLQSESGLN